MFWVNPGAKSMKSFSFITDESIIIQKKIFLCYTSPVDNLVLDVLAYLTGEW